MGSSFEQRLAVATAGVTAAGLVLIQRLDDLAVGGFTAPALMNHLAQLVG